MNATTVATHALLVCALWPTTCAADGDRDHFDVNLLHAAPGMQRLLVLDAAEAPPSLQLSARALVHYAREPLQLTRGGVPMGSAVQHRLTTDVAIAVAFLRRFQVSIALPVTWHQESHDPSGLGLGATESRGIEDLRVAGKAVLASNEWAGVGGALELVFPTGNAAQLLGSHGMTGSARVFGHVRAGWFQMAAMAGWRFAQHEEQFLSIRAGNSPRSSRGSASACRRCWPPSWCRSCPRSASPKWPGRRKRAGACSIA